MLRNLTIVRYLCFHNRRRNLNAYLNIYSLESFFFFEREFSNPGLIIEMMIQKNLKGFLITSHVKVFLGNKYNS